MKMRLILIISAIMLALGTKAAYKVHGVTGDVRIESGGKTVVVSKGMNVNPSDVIIIPEGGKLEIFNELDGKVYTSVKTGKLSVIRLMLDAKQKASDNSAAVKGQLNVGKSGGNTAARVYMEKGMVKRSHNAFGEDSENVDVDPKTLARYVASAVYTGNLDSRVELPVRVEHEKGDSIGRRFKLVNARDFPVYFNILKITGTESPILEISELGQPTGCYVVLPGQSLSREQFASPSPFSRHVLIVSHARYDMGEVIDVIGDLLSSEGLGTLPEENAPVQMITL
ncbi:MAG: hypothetical protein K2K64_12165 [Muribaculaceae bacterium]|nr:hypothetical protein [Muribaculaceae bacterium]